MDAELKKGSAGIYEVAVNGRVVLRKAGLAFPTDQEVVDAVAKAVGP